MAVLTLRRPKSLNALTLDAFRQLDAHLAAIQDDPKIRGPSSPASASGRSSRGPTSASSARSSPRGGPERRRRNAAGSCAGSRPSGKPVVAALNGLIRGRGQRGRLRLLGPHRPHGHSLLFGQPEVRLGIIPGAGATQRLPGSSTSRPPGGCSAPAERSGAPSRSTSGSSPRWSTATSCPRRRARPHPGARPARRRPAGPRVLPEVDLTGVSRKVDESPPGDPRRREAAARPGAGARGPLFRRSLRHARPPDRPRQLPADRPEAARGLHPRLRPVPRTQDPVLRQRAHLGPSAGPASERGSLPARLNPKPTMGFGRFAPVVVAPLLQGRCLRCREGPATAGVKPARGRRRAFCLSMMSRGDPLHP